MAKIGLPKGSGKQLKVREKSVKSLVILKWILSGNPGARHIYPSLVLVKPRKTRPCLTERLLRGCKESNQTKTKNNMQFMASTVCHSMPTHISVWGCMYPLVFPFVGTCSFLRVHIF